MTGYGTASYEGKEGRYTVEIKSLNSKFLELNLKLPKAFAHQELALRNECTRLFERGKVTVTIQVEVANPVDQAAKINIPLVRYYYQELQQIAAEMGMPTDGIFKQVLSMPDVILVDETTADDSEWERVYDVFLTACKRYDQYRLDEGAILKNDLQLRAQTILTLLGEVEVLEPNRIPHIKERLRGVLNQFVGTEHIDENRFEQELIYYIDKLDITEEKVRLKSHCDYFLENLNAGSSNGKKLGFLSQEMGREINTLGSKANDAAIQKVVVQMKEELEKIKEQLLNIV